MIENRIDRTLKINTTSYEQFPPIETIKQNNSDTGCSGFQVFCLFCSLWAFSSHAHKKYKASWSINADRGRCLEQDSCEETFILIRLFDRVEKTSSQLLEPFETGHRQCRKAGEFTTQAMLYCYLTTFSPSKGETFPSQLFSRVAFKNFKKNNNYKYN